MSYGGRRGSNLGEHVEERDSTGGLFSNGRVFGVDILPIEDDPGEFFSPDRPRGDDQTDWVTDPPAQEPLAADFVKPGGANGTWFRWDGTGPLALICPNNAFVRSIYIPVGPAANITFVAGAGGTINSGFYVSSAPAWETVPIAEGNKIVTLIAESAFAQPIFVYVTGDVLPPGRG